MKKRLFIVIICSTSAVFSAPPKISDARDVRSGIYEQVNAKDLSQAREELQYNPSFKQFQNELSALRANSDLSGIERVKVGDFYLGERYPDSALRAKRANSKCNNRRQMSDNGTRESIDRKSMPLISADYDNLCLKLAYGWDSLHSAPWSSCRIPRQLRWNGWEQASRFVGVSHTLATTNFPFNYSTNISNSALVMSKYGRVGSNPGEGDDFVSVNNDLCVSRYLRVCASDISEVIYQMNFYEEIKCLCLNGRQLSQNLNATLCQLSNSGAGPFGALVIPDNITSLESFSVATTNDKYCVEVNCDLDKMFELSEKFKVYHIVYNVTSLSLFKRAQEERRKIKDVLSSIKMPDVTDDELIAKCRKYEASREDLDALWDRYEESQSFYKPITNDMYVLSRMPDVKFGGFSFGSTNAIDIVEGGLDNAFGDKDEDSGLHFACIEYIGSNHFIENWCAHVNAKYSKKSRRLYEIKLFSRGTSCSRCGARKNNNIRSVLDTLIEHLDAANGESLIALDENMFKKIVDCNGKPIKMKRDGLPPSTYATMKQKIASDKVGSRSKYKSYHTKTKNRLNISISEDSCGIHLIISSPDFKLLAMLESGLSCGL